MKKKMIITSGVMRLDAVNSDTADGSIIVPALIAKVGVREYAEFDDVKDEFVPVREAHLSEHLFQEDTLKSAAGAIVTHFHPWRMLDEDNYDLYMKGFSIGNAEKFVEDGEEYLKVDLKIFDKNLQLQVLNKKHNGISAGYYTDVVKEPGTVNGEAYDAYTTNIRVNHIAFVPPEKARGGADLGAILDSVESVDFTKIAFDSDLNISSADLAKHLGKRRTDAQTNTNTEEEVVMKKVRIDGVDFEVSDAVAARMDTLESDAKVARKAAETAQEKLDSAEQEKTDAVAAEKANTAEVKKDLDTVQAKLDTKDEELTASKAKVEDLQTKLDSSMTTEEWEAKTELAGKVKSITGTEVDLKLDSKDMMLEALKVAKPGVKFDSKSEDYITARFDSVIESLEDEGFAPSGKMDEAGTVTLTPGTEEKEDSTDGRMDYAGGAHSTHWSKQGK